MVLIVAWVVVLVGCGVPERGSPDAGATADTGRADAAIDESLMPFATTGVTPAGSLVDARFIGVQFRDGFCPRGLRVSLYRTNHLRQYPIVYFEVPMPWESTEPPTGTIDATAEILSPSDIMAPASFEVAHVDLPPTDPLRTAGRMTVSTTGWQVDFSFDAEAEHLTCF